MKSRKEIYLLWKLAQFVKQVRKNKNLLQDDDESLGGQK